MKWRTPDESKEYLHKRFGLYRNSAPDSSPAKRGPKKANTIVVESQEEKPKPRKYKQGMLVSFPDFGAGQTRRGYLVDCGDSDESGMVARLASLTEELRKVEGLWLKVLQR